MEKFEFEHSGFLCVPLSKRFWSVTHSLMRYMQCINQSMNNFILQQHVNTSKCKQWKSNWLRRGKSSGWNGPHSHRTCSLHLSKKINPSFHFLITYFSVMLLLASLNDCLANSQSKDEIKKLGDPTPWDDQNLAILQERVRKNFPYFFSFYI